MPQVLAMSKGTVRQLSKHLQRVGRGRADIASPGPASVDCTPEIAKLRVAVERDVHLTFLNLN